MCRFQQDTLLGVATVPLSPLLQESWVQGTAPVLSVMSKADGQTQESMQVCAKNEPRGYLAVTYLHACIGAKMMPHPALRTALIANPSVT